MTMRYCTTPREVLEEQYKTLRYKISNNTLVEEDVKHFPLDFSPTNAKTFSSMLSKFANHWTLAEFYILCNKKQPPNWLYVSMDQYHNSVFMYKGKWCFKREIEKPLTLSLLLKIVQNNEVVLF